ncbi:MAG: carbamoyltransferase [Phycisphaeraceae bacterium]|nr:carbamoyltransferase [Phycisphaeraceae bacterium]
MNILGVSAFYHDSAACLVRDGDIIAAAQEERFSRQKHDHRLPVQAMAYCLREGGIGPGDIDYVAFYDKPVLKFERLLETYLAFAPVGFRSFLEAMPLWLRQKLYVPRQLDRALEGAYKRSYLFCEHHESHAASAFFPSPFEEAAILTLDGVGEWATATYGVGRGNRIELTRELRFPHSLGLLYSAFTYFTGFRVNSGEYKLMGLAPFGRPIYKDIMLRELMDLKDDGSFRLNMKYFPYGQSLRMTGPELERLLGVKRRRPESAIRQEDMDVAASIQAVTEEVVLRGAREVARQTGMKNLVLAGGVALNCVANGHMLREGIFENVWIQPAAGDAGGALGAALLVWHQILDKPRTVSAGEDRQHGSFLGPAFATLEIQEFLDGVGAVYEQLTDEDQLIARIVDCLEQQKVVGFFQGRMEFGPRALGGRSILGDARSERMQSFMNLKIKFRESFRPFAPAVLREEAGQWFDLPANVESPYMLLVAPVRQERRSAGSADDFTESVSSRINRRRSVIPAVTHVDYSARVQTVDAKRHGRFYRLLKGFQQRTNCPVLVNTSFNIRGEPIVCTPQDAYRCFMATDMDVLVLEDFVLRKADQPRAQSYDLNAYLKGFELD